MASGEKRVASGEKQLSFFPQAIHTIRPHIIRPRLRFLKLRSLVLDLSGGSVFLGQRGGEEAFEFWDAAGGFQAVGEVFPFAAGGLLPERRAEQAQRRAETVQALALPPASGVRGARQSVRCWARSYSKNRTVVRAISAHARTAAKSWKRYWWKPSVDFHSWKNSSICPRSESSSITSVTLIPVALVSRIFTSSGVAVLRCGFVCVIPCCSDNTPWCQAESETGCGGPTAGSATPT